MERAKLAAHLVSSPSTSTPVNPSLRPPTNDSSTNATTAAPPLTAQWSVEQGKTPLSPKLFLSALPQPPPPNPTTSLPFLHTLERLKTTPREGWLRFPIIPPGTESIADHMYRMSILTLLAPQPLRPRLNIPRCTLLALVHDMAEALVGDITPKDGVEKPEKSRRERTSMSYLTHSLLGQSTGCADAGREIREAWEEYEAGVTLESKFVHDVDKLELVLQMMEYERRGEGQVDLGEFTRAAEGIQLEEMKGWCREVFREREEFWKGVGIVPKYADFVARFLAAEDEGK